MFAVALPQGRSSLPGPGFEVPAARLSGFLRVDANGISQVFRQSIPCLCSVPRPRSNRRALAITVTSMLPPLCAQRRLRATLDFGANPQLQHLLSYASCFALPLTRKARFRLAGSAFAGRASNPPDRCERFQLVLTIFLPSCSPDASAMRCAIAPYIPVKRVSFKLNGCATGRRNYAHPAPLSQPTWRRQAGPVAPWPQPSLPRARPH